MIFLSLTQSFPSFSNSEKPKSVIHFFLRNISNKVIFSHGESRARWQNWINFSSKVCIGIKALILRPICLLIHLSDRLSAILSRQLESFLASTPTVPSSLHHKMENCTIVSNGICGCGKSQSRYQHLVSIFYINQIEAHMRTGCSVDYATARFTSVNSTRISSNLSAYLPTEDTRPISRHSLI